MSLFDVVAEPTDVTAPALIVSFEDWVDAGGAGTTAARHIAEGGELVATVDADAIYDYRSHRPILDIVDGAPKEFVWPSLELIRRRLPERDLFVLTGPEPDYRWREFAEGVLELALRIGIIEHVSLGAIPAAVPHTAPTPVMMTASSSELMKGGSPNQGLLRVPAAAVSLVEWTLAQNGIPAVGFWAQVPHYATPYAAGAIALIRRVEDHLTVTIGAGSLEQEVAAQRTALEALFSDNPDATEYLERLEGLLGEQQIPPAEHIGEEVERFLRNQRRGDGGPTPFSPGNPS
jgi:predicted ATP-grasp superfamily ATP-dependent carboligase